MRISIIGLPGSGKSTLAKKLSSKLGVLHLEIDRLWFEAGGLKTRGDALGKKEVGDLVIEKVKELIKGESWISDGWYAQKLIAERADEIIFLDISLGRRLLNHLRRALFTQRHPEITGWDEIKFLYQIIHRTFKHGPRMREFVLKNNSKVKTFHSYQEVGRYLADF